MKKYIAGLITGIILSLSFATFAAVQLKVIPNPFPIFVDGVNAEIDGYNINGSTYIKLADLKKAGVEAKFDSTKKQIEISSVAESTTNAEPTITSKQSPTFLYEGDDVKNTTYNGFKTVSYNGDTFISEVEFSKKLKITVKHSVKLNSPYTFYKDDVKILETLDSTPEYYIIYEGRTYFNVNFLGKHLEE